MESAQTRTLERALRLLGSKERLAAALQIPVADLDDYLAGKKRLPYRAFIAAIDIVARGRIGGDDESK